MTSDKCFVYDDDEVLSIGINEIRLPLTVIRQHWLEQWLVSHTLTPLSSGRSSKEILEFYMLLQDTQYFPKGPGIV